MLLLKAFYPIVNKLKFIAHTLNRLHAIIYIFSPTDKEVSSCFYLRHLLLFLSSNILTIKLLLVFEVQTNIYTFQQL